MMHFFIIKKNRAFALIFTNGADYRLLRFDNINIFDVDIENKASIIGKNKMQKKEVAIYGGR